MSRIGKQPVVIPNGVTVKCDAGIIEVSGPKGVLKRNTYGRVGVLVEKGKATVTLAEGEHNRYWGLYRTLLANMIEGVTKGFRKELELQGVGYRATLNGKTLTLTVGFSHPVNIEPPPGIVFEVDAKTNRIAVVGAEKELVGEVAAKVRAVRPPEPYHGKGIRYVGEVIRAKVGKSASGSKK